VAFHLIYTQKAVDDINKLDSVVKKRLGKKLEKFKENPLQYAKKLIDPKLGQYRFRIGNYRIIFDLEGDDIIILRVGHRSEIYK